MLMNRLSVAALAVGLSLSTPVFAQDADTVLATVGGVDITLGSVIAATENLPDQYSALEDSVLLNGILDQLVQQQALSQSLGDALSKRDALGLANELRAYRANIVLQGAAEAAISDAAVQAAYEAQYADATTGTEYNAAHILVETEEEALALIAELDGGADFAELAKEHSTGPSGPNGGALGWFGKGMMVPTFEAAVLELEVGAVSPPVETQFGWHVVKLNESRPLDAPELATVRGEIEAQLQQAAVAETISSLTSSIEITRSDEEIDPALIRKSELLD